MFEHIPPELKSAGPGIAGSLLALAFMRRPPLILLGIFFGGCALSFFGTAWLADVLDMEKADGLVGFLLGLFGMALVAKIYDTIEVVEPALLWKALLERFRKLLGLEAK